MSIIIPIVGGSVAGFSSDIRTVHLAVILVSVRDYTAQGTVDAVSVGDWTIEGMMGDGVAVVAMVEGGTGEQGVPWVGDFAVRADIGGGGGGWCCDRFFTDMGALTPGMNPRSYSRSMFACKPRHGGVGGGVERVGVQSVKDGSFYWSRGMQG